MADPIDNHPFYELDPGSPHMDSEDYQHMGLAGPQSGPEGQPDQALAQQVQDRLRQHTRLDATRIQVEVRGNSAILTGIAPDRHARGRAAELAAEVEGVGSVVNRIVIQPPEPEPGPSLTVREPGTVKDPSTERS